MMEGRASEETGGLENIEEQVSVQKSVEQKSPAETRRPRTTKVHQSLSFNDANIDGRKNIHPAVNFWVNSSSQAYLQRDDQLSQKDAATTAANSEVNSVLDGGMEKEMPQKNVSMSEVVSYFRDVFTSHKKQIRLNCFLFVLLGMILTAIIIFVIVKPTAEDQNAVLPLNSFARVRPLDRSLALFQPEFPSLDPLELVWGFHSPSSLGKLPAFCRRDGTDCSHGHCCLRYPDHSKIELRTKFHGTAGCVEVNWSRDSEPSGLVTFTDCVFAKPASRHWFLGLQQFRNISWPRRWPTRSFIPVQTGDFSSEHPNEFLGILEPFWMTSDGFALWITSTASLKLNSTKDYFCFQTINILNYTVCKASDLRDLYFAHRADTVQNESRSWIEDKMILGLNVSTVSDDNVHALASSIASLKPRLPEDSWKSVLVNLQDLDPFDKVHIRKLKKILATLKKNDSLKKLKLGVEISNMISPTTAFASPTLRSHLLGLKKNGAGHRSIGLVNWHFRLWDLIDLTRKDSAEWFREFLTKQWPPMELADELTVAGGAASLLSASSDLNVTDGNANFYSHKFVEAMAQVPSTILTSVGFKTFQSSLFTSVPVTPARAFSAIPMALSFNLQGYVRTALDIRSIRPLSAHSTRLLLQLAMFFPVFRVPAEFLHCSAKDVCPELDLIAQVFEKFGSLRREVVLPHYANAFSAHLKTGDPVIRPMWWDPETARVSATRFSDCFELDNQFTIGNDLVVAIFPEHPRVENKIFLPKGVWKHPSWKEGVVNVTHGQFIIFATEDDVTCFLRVL